MEICHLQHASTAQKSVGWRKQPQAAHKQGQHVQWVEWRAARGREWLQLPRTHCQRQGEGGGDRDEYSYACAPSADRVLAFSSIVGPSGGVSSWAWSEQPNEAMERRLHSCYASRSVAIVARGRRAA